MPPEQTTILDVVRVLIEGTKKGRIKWESDASQSDVFFTTLQKGYVRVSQLVSFTGPGEPLLFELLDKEWRTISKLQPDTSDDYPVVRELYDLARSQALNLDQTLAALVEEIQSRSR